MVFGVFGYLSFSFSLSLSYVCQHLSGVCVCRYAPDSVCIKFELVDLDWATLLF